jgi:hypothetical protein
VRAERREFSDAISVDYVIDYRFTTTGKRGFYNLRLGNVMKLTKA